MQEQMNIGMLEVGTIDEKKELLEPNKVKIVDWEKKFIEKAHGDKIEFVVKHPDKEEPIRISAVSFLRGKQVITSGTWFNLDSEGKIKKASSLSIFINSLGAKNLNDTIGKEVETEASGIDGNSKYLVFKAY